MRAGINAGARDSILWRKQLDGLPQIWEVRRWSGPVCSNASGQKLNVGARPQDVIDAIVYVDGVREAT
jgi:hypothetical protein